MAVSGLLSLFQSSSSAPKQIGHEYLLLALVPSALGSNTTLEQLIEKIAVTLAHPRDREIPHHVLPRVGAEARAQARIPQNAHCAGGVALRVDPRQQEPGLAIDDLLAGAAIVVRNHRHAGSERFERGIRTALLL